ncbi:MAG: hypothetical protein JXB50_03930 [Spirochaetes bacterium]|nr:hypothetical protein [Spirochaetota bacterium]
MKKLIIIITLLLFILNLNSQEIIDAPFISNISFEVSNAKVLIQWENPSNFDQYLTIYRSNSIIDTNPKIFTSQKIAVLKKQEEKYTDTLESEGSYYYSVIITNKNTNNDYIVLIPYRNYTLKPAVIQKEDFFTIKSLKVSSKNSYIDINWDYEKSSETSTKVLIYRNINPIENDKILQSSIKIATLNIESKSYIDVPLPNITYYYAIFVENEKEKKFISDINISTNPVMIRGEDFTLKNFSIDYFIPLPLLSIKNDPVTGKSFVDPQVMFNPKKIDYTKKTKEIIEDDKLLYKDIYYNYEQELKSKYNLLEANILNNEVIFETEDYKNEYKNAIIYFNNKEYDLALNIFENLTLELIPENLLNRISYYIGLLYYLKGNFYLSYIYLNYSYESFKKEVEPYLNSIYAIIFEKLER